MTLIDIGLENGLEFGHTDYRTGEGRFVSHSENLKERYINPELSVKERARISIRDNHRRNKYNVSLFCENNVRIKGFVTYNPITEGLSFSWVIFGNHGKKIVRLN